jgi:hypothetical protein
MDQLQATLRERQREIFLYLRLLVNLESAGGRPILKWRKMEYPIELSTIHALKAGAFLHLYNAIEFTVRESLDHVASEVAATSKFADLDIKWRKAWIKSKLHFDQGLSTDTVLSGTLLLCDTIAQGAPLTIKPRMNVGNLDDKTIDDLMTRYGIPMKLSPRVLAAVKWRVRNDDLGCLGLVRSIRNDLAHGKISFADIGKSYSAADIVRWSITTIRYLRQFVTSCKTYIESRPS